MNISLLEKKLTELSFIPPYSYSLSGELKESAYIIRFDNKDWTVFYFEKGTMWDTCTFNNESSACNYLWEVLTQCKWHPSKFKTVIKNEIERPNVIKLPCSDNENKQC